MGQRRCHSEVPCVQATGDRLPGSRITHHASRSVCLLVAVLCAAIVTAAEPPAPKFQLSLRKALDTLPFRVHGFFETRAGTRTQQDRYVSETASIGESRLQLELSKVLEIGELQPELRIKSDFLYDAITRDATTALREAFVLVSPFEFADLKLGRQVLTWGTGDLLFINDLFPKSWRSFFIGRDDEYLKAPSDAAKASFFSDIANLDVVYSARFQADEYITGERLSYWSDGLRSRAGEDARVRDSEPDHWFDDDEIALRLYRNISGYEFALYGYHGYWPTPAGMNPLTGKATFPKLSVAGASARGAVLKGIGNIEVGYYHSRDDDAGTDPLVRNSEFRLLLGYEQEVAKDFTAGLQYYIEWMMDHGAYKQGARAAGIHPRDEVRHLITLRLTRLLLNQNLKLSLFTYYSPTDSDTYLRPKVHYKIDDHWSAEVGGNIFLGAHEHTFFGQFERNTNAYAGVRYSF